MINFGTVSLVIPVYNVFPQFPRCIRSILSQTYADLQVILVDDGSTDGSDVLCDDYAAADSRIIVLHQENSGAAAARNAGMNAATGDYIGFIDADDSIAPNYVESLLTAIRETDASAAVCLRGAPPSDDTALVPVPVSSAMERRVSGREALLICMSGKSYSISPSAALFPKSYVLAQPFPSEFCIGEDYVWVCKLYPALPTICLVNIPLYYYYTRGDSLSNGFQHLDGNWLSRWDNALQSHEYCLSLRPDDAEFQALALHRIWYFLYLRTEVAAYYCNAPEEHQFFHSRLHPYRHAFFHSPYSPTGRKLRYHLLEALILLRAPRPLVRFFATRYFYKIKQLLLLFTLRP